MKEIPIDAKTQAMLQDLLRVSNELQGRMQIICSVIANGAGVEQKFSLAPDCSKLLVENEQAD